MDAVPVLIDVLANSGGDPLIPHIVWNNLQPLIDQHSGAIAHSLAQFRILIEIRHFLNLFRVCSKGMLAARDLDRVALRELFLLALHSQRPEAARRSLQLLTARVQSRELAGPRLRIGARGSEINRGIGAGRTSRRPTFLRRRFARRKLERTVRNRDRAESDL